LKKGSSRSKAPEDRKKTGRENDRQAPSCHRSAQGWALEANQNDPAGLALACQALDAAFGDNDVEAHAFFTMLEQTAP